MNEVPLGGKCDFKVDPPSENERVKFFKDTQVLKPFDYFDKNERYIGKYMAKTDNSYIFLNPDSKTTTKLSDQDVIFYKSPVDAVGGRRKQRTNRRKNKNRRTKSRRNRRS
jgi:hypothetical protein